MCNLCKHKVIFRLFSKYEKIFLPTDSREIFPNLQEIGLIPVASIIERENY